MLDMVLCIHPSEGNDELTVQPVTSSQINVNANVNGVEPVEPSVAAAVKNRRRSGGPRGVQKTQTLTESNRGCRSQSKAAAWAAWLGYSVLECIRTEGSRCIIFEF